MRTLLALLFIALPTLAQAPPTAESPSAVAPDDRSPWAQYGAIMAELEVVVEEARAAELAVRQEGNDWAGTGFSAYYWQPGYGRRVHRARERARLAAVLDDWTARGVFEHTAALANLHGIKPPPTSPGDPPAFSLRLIRELARIQIARMHLAAERGDDDTRLIAFEELLSMQRLHLWQDHLIAWGVAESGARDACAELLRTQLRFPMTRDIELARADLAIESEAVDKWMNTQGVATMIRDDLLHIIAQTYADGGEGDGVFHPEAYDDLLRGAPRRVDLEEYRGPFESHSEARAWSDTFLALVSTMLQSSGQAYIDAERAAQSLIDEASPAIPLAGDFGPVYLFIVRNERRRGVLVDGSRVVLAIERYRVANGGASPATLADLGPLLSQELRSDPMSGEPWLYSPEPLQTDEYGRPLLPGAAVWPYTLRGRVLPGVESPVGYARDATEGLLINPPIQGHDFDPEPDEAEGN
ncbi:hypothetical protein AY599_16110 [Leptolyngbya valderiana BDU 20041]|nr:hypothetical protein AY599_16110 [Leptolyngbya valderiana BDU 20041]